MSLITFFFSAQGRIGRTEYWLGLLASIALSMAVSAVVDPGAMNVENGVLQPPTLAGTIWNLLITWPSTAIAIKRFNDRDWPYWTGFALGGLMVAMVVANYFGLLLHPDQMSPLEKLVMVGLVVAFLWSIIENGFNVGTTGANRYGPDPLFGRGRGDATGG